MTVRSVVFFRCLCVFLLATISLIFFFSLMFLVSAFLLALMISELILELVFFKENVVICVDPETHCKSVSTRTCCLVTPQLKSRTCLQCASSLRLVICAALTTVSNACKSARRLLRLKRIYVCIEYIIRDRKRKKQKTRKQNT